MEERGRGGLGFLKLLCHRRYKEIIRTLGEKVLERQRKEGENEPGEDGVTLALDVTLCSFPCPPPASCL